MKILGVEEAGRGPVIGPLVMVGILIDEEKEQNLVNIGVKDSKQLSPLQREQMYDRILEAAEKYKIIILQPKDIDATLNSPDTNLNWLEADTSIKIINELDPDKAILDCPSNNCSVYTAYVLERLKDKDTEIISEHKADEKYPVVSAASIIAKVTRDKEVAKIRAKIGIDFGSGYPSDPKTVSFLKENYDKYDIFRKTWASYKKVAAQKSQKTLI